MKITLTGAAGHLGSRLGAALIEAGHTVRAVDQVTRRDLSVPVEVVNLLDREKCYALLEGADAVVHLANHSNDFMRDKQRLINENVTMNTNVFQAARELGVQNVVFTSSIQAIGQGGKVGENHTATLAYLPIDGALPARPTNPYGLSKYLSEEMLRFYAREAGMNCVAIRFPYLSRGLPGADHISNHVHTDRLNEAWSYLSFRDASNLIIAILAAPLTGFRIYCPAAQRPLSNQPIGTLIENYYSGIPLKKPHEEIDSFFDISRIKEETGWEPQDELPPL